MKQLLFLEPPFIRTLIFSTLSLLVSLSAQATDFRVVGTVRKIFCNTSLIEESVACPTDSEIVIDEVLFHSQPYRIHGLNLANSKGFNMKTGDFVFCVYNETYDTTDFINLSHVPFSQGTPQVGQPVKMNSLIDCVTEAFITSPWSSTKPAQTIVDARTFCSSPGVVSLDSVERCLSEAKAVKGLGLNELDARAFCLKL